MVMSDIIPIDRSVIPACDVGLERFEEIVRETDGVPKIGGYKIGASLALSAGLPRVAEVARKHTAKPLIYDHQKACTDIPPTGQAFVAAVKDAGIDAVILFPLSGPATQTAWIQSAQEAGLAVIIGGHMTHERYLLSEGGYVDDAAVAKMFTIAANHGITDYVVPGNKPSVISGLRELLESHSVQPVFYAPAFIAQGGQISEAASVAGARWHAIVGRAIYESREIRKAAEALVTHL